MKILPFRQGKPLYQRPAAQAQQTNLYLKARKIRKVSLWQSQAMVYFLLYLVCFSSLNSS
jgi:hypothetical protein